MAEPFLSEIRLFSFNFPPKGWAFCNGQFLPINQNQALFALLGTTYGGNGQTTFALPNLQGHVPIHTGSGHTLGERAGSEAVTINQQTMPAHIHTVQANSANGTDSVPSGRTFARVVGQIYTGAANFQTLVPETLTNAGGSQPHTNMMPYLTLNFCIALQGIFPSRN